MKPRPLCDKLNQVLNDGLANQIFLAVQPHSLAGPPKLQSLGPFADLGMISPGGVKPAEFVKLLEEGRFSAVFDDAALLGIECTFDRDKLRSHRYSFIPCPFDPDLVALRPEGTPIADWLRESVIPYGMEAIRSVGTYRFDCVRKSPERSTDPHPTSHFTFGSSSCRMPVRGPMSIADFFNFLFDNFYRDARPFWLDHAPFLTCEGVEPTITWDEQQLHHLQWMEEY